VAITQSCLNPIEREDDGQLEEDDAEPGSVDDEAMRSDGVRLPHNVVVNNREKRQRAEAALKPKAAPEPAEPVSGLGLRHIRVFLPLPSPLPFPGLSGQASGFHVSQFRAGYLYLWGVMSVFVYTALENLARCESVTTLTHCIGLAWPCMCTTGATRPVLI